MRNKIKKMYQVPAVFIATFLIMLFLNQGLSLSLSLETLQTFMLTIIFCISLFLPRFRKYIFYFCLFLIVMGIGLLIINRVDLADLFDSLAYGFIVVTIITYLPQLIKRGYINQL